MIGGSILGRLARDGRAERRKEALARGAAGRLRAHIGSTFSLADAAAAHQAMADRTVLGKALLDCTGQPG